MKNTLENLKKMFSKNIREKHFFFSGGTVFFLAFNLLLIVGFCRFSFYVLKNHRSVMEHDTLIKTYVDVQPYAAQRKDVPSYISLSAEDKTAPAPFFIKKDETEVSAQTVFDKASPVPVLKTSVPENPVVAKVVTRPPVIRPVVARPTVHAEPEKESVTIKDEPVQVSQAVSLDSLIASGLDLLDASEETVITASERFLQEDVPPETKPAVKENIPATKETIPSVSVPVKKNDVKSKETIATRWVDVAELRRRLADDKQAEIKKQNAALLEMNGSKQIAALNTETLSDASENKSEKAVVTEKEPIKTAGNETANANSGSGLKQGTVFEPRSEQIAVVQDIPFSETSSGSETAGKTDPASVPVKNNSVLAGNSPDLWKIAKVKGKTQISANVKKTPEMKKPEQGNTLAGAKPDLIYRNGRAVATIQQPEKKSLNWLDRQEAAVWTSMSQSDTPSVWSAAMETQKAPSETAKAFRVADEQPSVPEKTEENKSSTVRVVGEASQPEAKENPLLLPLGNSDARTKAAPDTPPSVSPSGTPSVFGGLPPQTNSGQGNSVQPADKKAINAEDGLMTKIFSFFGKNDPSDSVPNIGTPNPVKTEQQEQIPVSASPVAGSKNSQAVVTSTPLVSKTKTEEKQIIPTEMRLTFKPDSTEISVQSIKWIKALGQKTKKDIQNAIEVRMSNIDPALQNKRFAIIRSTLLGVGVEEIQIIPVFTDRTPHTIVLRMIILPEEGYTEYTTENNGVKERLYYKQW